MIVNDKLNPSHVLTLCIQPAMCMRAVTWLNKAISRNTAVPRGAIAIHNEDC